MTSRPATSLPIVPLDVLIVEDERFTREIMEALITSLGHRVHTVASGVEALAYLLEDCRRADVILMDVLMPGIDGLETTRRLRAHPAMQDTVIIGVSAKADGLSPTDGLRAGCDNYLTKPAHEDRIFRAITEALRHRGRLTPGQAFA